MKTFNTLLDNYKTISKDSSTANETLGKILLNDFIREILRLSDWTFNRTTATDLTEADKQYYPLPYNCQKLRKIIVNVSNTIYTLNEIKDEEQWSRLNMVNISSDVLTSYFLKPSTHEIGIYPIPSTAGYTITFTYQEKYKDLGVTDYTTGTVSATNGSSTITGSGTTWTSAMVGRYIQITDFWYEIAAVGSTTSLTIQGEFGENTVSGASHTIAELVPLSGFENLPLYKALWVYFQSRDTAGARQQANQYLALYEKGLDDLFNTDSKTTSNVLQQTSVENINPNDWPTLS